MEMSTPIEIERVGTLSVEEFRNYYLKNHKPVVITGGINHWPAVSQWTPEYLKKNSAGAMVNVKSKSDYVGGKSMREDEGSADVTLSQLVEFIDSDAPPDLSYVRESEILNKLPKLLNDIDPSPAFIPDDTNPSGPLLWVGPGGTVAQMHWDPWHNLFTQVSGGKYLILVPPQESRLTYPNLFTVEHMSNFPYVKETRPQLVDKMKKIITKLDVNGDLNVTDFQEVLPDYLDADDIACLVVYLRDINNSHVDAENPDLTKHPLYSKTTRYQTLLNAGDLIFIPYCWRHYVRSLEPSISISWFFDQSEGEFDSRTDIHNTVCEHLEP